MRLFGQDWTRRELAAYADLEQLAGITRYTLNEGFERDVEMIEVRTGAGLRFTVCPSRGLDILSAEFRGTNLIWRGPNGAMHPAFYNEANFGWLRGFAGGLLTTCGLGSFGPACEDGGEAWGIHDRIAYTPAREVTAKTYWLEEDDCQFAVGGTLRQARLFGPNLQLERRVWAKLGENRFTLIDHLSNEGFEPEPAVILYHCNFGFPLVAPGARVVLDATETTPRDEAAAAGAEQWAEISAPEPGYREKVYSHELRASDDFKLHAGIWNPHLGLGVRLSFDPDQLPYFTQWKQLGSGAYVMGLEPSNAPLASRADLRARGELPMLEPGEKRRIEWEFAIVESEADM